MTKKDELIDKYKGRGWTSQFVKIRFWDAPFLEVEKLIPTDGTIVDLGCGEGIFTNFLAICSNKRRIIGIELNKERIKKANLGFKNIKFLEGDATKITYPQADVIVMFHLMHHLNSYVDQEILLKKCVSRLKSNGKLIVVEIDKNFSIKYLITWFTDHFLVPWVFNHRFYDPIFFRKKNDWQLLLNKLGLTCQVLNADKNKPFSHIIFVCKKNK